MEELVESFDKWFVRTEVDLRTLLRNDLRLTNDTMLEDLFRKIAPLRTPKTAIESEIDEDLKVGKRIDPSMYRDETLNEFIQGREIFYCNRAQVVSAIGEIPAEEVQKRQEGEILKLIEKRCREIYIEPHKDVAVQLLASYKGIEQQSRKKEKAASVPVEEDDAKLTGKRKRRVITKPDDTMAKAKAWFIESLEIPLLYRDLEHVFTNIFQSGKMTPDHLTEAFSVVGMEKPSNRDIVRMINDANGATSFQDVFQFIREHALEKVTD